MVRGLRLSAAGLVEAPVPLVLEPGPAPTPTAHRRTHTGDGWHEAPVYDGETLRPGPKVEGPALVEWPFTTLVLAPGDGAATLESGDVLVEVADPASSARSTGPPPPARRAGTSPGPRPAPRGWPGQRSRRNERTQSIETRGDSKNTS